MQQQPVHGLVPCNRTIKRFVHIVRSRRRKQVSVRLIISCCNQILMLHIMFPRPSCRPCCTTGSAATETLLLSLISLALQ
uniref:ARAD1C43626p n=1 Tax=Blastobotrys adeninivorans TaxID=409370 RepID=A0A060T3X1_BLAAD